MNKRFINISAACSLFILASCASQPKLQQPQVLNTEYIAPTYYYCFSESCIKPSQLQKAEYKPLEPDEPIITSMQLETPKAITQQNKKKRYTKKRIHKPITKKTVKPKPKHIPQCVMWK
jgi:hypothetical protein